jgi:hypothetical protein
MAYTVEQLANQVKIERKIPTTNTTTLPYDWFYNAIGRAMRVISKEVPFWYTTQTVTTADGTATYSLEAGTLEVLKAYITGDSPMGTVDFDTFAHAQSLVSKGKPRRFILLHDNPGAANNQPGIGFYLIPNGIYTVNLWTKKTYVTALSASSDSLDIPADWQDCIVFFLVGFSYERDEDFDSADRWFAKAGEKLQQIIGIEQDRNNRAALSERSRGRVKIVGGVEYDVG